MTFFNFDELEGTLRQALEPELPDPSVMLRVGLAVLGTEEGPTAGLADTERGEVLLMSGERTWNWKVPSLRGLFRGNRQPPHLGDEPQEYQLEFTLLDLHVLDISRVLGPRRDAEMEEIYSALRRRPDGRSLGRVHDHMWRAAALMLGTHPRSQAEFEAILARVEKSCRRFGQGPTSWNYVAALEETIGQGT